MPTPIPAPTVFPFEPDAAFDVQEQWSYATDIITSKIRRERRVPLVQVPRIILTWTVSTTSQQETSRLLGMLWVELDNRWYGPRWPSARAVTAVAGTVYSCDTTAADFQVAGKALVWKDSATYDVMTVNGVAGNSVTLAGATSFTHNSSCYVIPLLVGSINIQQKIDRSGELAQCEIIFTSDVSGMNIPGAGVAPLSFGGVEVLTEVFSTEGLTENWDLRSVVSGGAASTPFIVRALDDRQTTDATLGWLATTRAEIAAMKQFIARRRGRLVPVWIPTLTQEMVVGASAASGQPVLSIPNFDYSTYYTADTARRTLLIVAGGTVIPATINSWIGANVTLSTNLPVTVPKGATVSLLKLSRLQNDAITMTSIPGNIAVQSVMSFTELPSETP